MPWAYLFDELWTNYIGDVDFKCTLWSKRESAMNLIPHHPTTPRQKDMIPEQGAYSPLEGLISPVSFQVPRSAGTQTPLRVCIPIIQSAFYEGDRSLFTVIWPPFKTLT